MFSQHFRVFHGMQNINFEIVTFLFLLNRHLATCFRNEIRDQKIAKVFNFLGKYIKHLIWFLFEHNSYILFCRCMFIKQYNSIFPDTLSLQTKQAFAVIKWLVSCYYKQKYSMYEVYSKFLSNCYHFISYFQDISK